MKKVLLTAALSAALSTAAVADPVTYAVDPTHAQVEFTYSHMGFSNITGRFDTIEGSITYDPQDPSSASVEVTVDVNSVSTGVPKLDDHIKAADFLDAAVHPKATFKSTSVAAAGTDKLKVTGDLSIHGVTLPASFDVTVNKVGEHPMRGVPAAGFDATGTIERAAFGVDKYLQATGPEVKLSITIEALGAKP
jgi:polyisoprenoid-binding protein YceI